MAKKLTKSKARKILHDKEVHGHPLTEQQRKFFGAIAGGAKPYKAESGGWLDKFDAPQAQNGIEGTMGGLTDVGFNYNGAWGGPSMQMGGVLPGAVGFTYARTQSPAPANGPYAKKTKASAQNGQEMKYYQEGLDFKPKTISQNGSRTPIVVSDPRDRRLTRYNDSLALYNNYVQNKNLIESALRPQFKKMGYEDINKYTEPYNRDRNFFELPDGSSTVLSYGKNERVTAPQYKTDTDAVNRRKIIRHKVGNITVPEYEQLWSTSIAPVRITKYNPGDGFYSVDKNFTGDIYSIDKTELVPYDIRRLEDSPRKRQMLKERAEFVKKWPYTITPSKFNYSFGIDEYVEPVQPVIYKPDVKSYTLPTPKEPTLPKLYKYDPNTPTKFSFTYPTGGYNEQKTMYFPTRSAWKSYVEGIKGTEKFKSSQEGVDYGQATGYLQDGGDIPVDPMGYWNPENVGNPVTIPSNIITMEGVDQPLLGISDTGDVQYMEPGEDYEFDGEYVTEYPVAQAGRKVEEQRLAESQQGAPLSSIKKTHPKFYKWMTREGKTPTGVYGMLSVKDNDPSTYTKASVAYEKSQKREPIYVSDPKDPRLKSYQDSLYNYNVGRRLAGILDADKNLVKVTPGSPYDKALQAGLKASDYKLRDNTKEDTGGYKNYERVASVMREYQKKGNRGILPIRFQGYFPDPDNTAIDLVTLRSVWDKLGVTDPRPPGAAHLPQWKKPEQQVILDPSKAPKKTTTQSKPKPKPPVKKEVPKVETKQQEVVKKPEPVVEKKAPLTDYFQGTPIYAPTPYHGSGAGAFVGYRTPQGDTVFVKPEDYERMGVPKYGREFIESQTKKQRNGGNLPTAQKGKTIPAPTTADSARLYNAQVALNKFYENEMKAGRIKKDYTSDFNPRNSFSSKSELIPEGLRQANLDFYRGEIEQRNKFRKLYSDEFYKHYFNLSPEQVKQLEYKGLAQTKGGSEYQDYYRDLITPMQNLASPFALVDYRIKPQRYISYYPIDKKDVTYPGGNVLVYDYDPLAIKPYHMRTPQEKIEWERKYGNKEKPKEKPKAKPTPPPVKKKVVTPTPEPVKESKVVPVSPEAVRKTILSTVPSGGVGIFGPGNTRIGEYDESTNTFYPDYENLAGRKKVNQPDIDLLADQEKLSNFITSKTGKKPKINVKQRNGGVNKADEYPIEKLDQLLNFTNYNKPTKGGWLDKYN